MTDIDPKNSESYQVLDNAMMTAVMPDSNEKRILDSLIEMNSGLLFSDPIEFEGEYFQLFARSITNSTGIWCEHQCASMECDHQHESTIKKEKVGCDHQHESTIKKEKTECVHRCATIECAMECGLYIPRYIHINVADLLEFGNISQIEQDESFQETIGDSFGDSVEDSFGNVVSHRDFNQKLQNVSQYGLSDDCIESDEFVSQPKKQLTNFDSDVELFFRESQLLCEKDMHSDSHECIVPVFIRRSISNGCSSGFPNFRMPLSMSETMMDYRSVTGLSSCPVMERSSSCPFP